MFFTGGRSAEIRLIFSGHFTHLKKEIVMSFAQIKMRKFEVEFNKVRQTISHKNVNPKSLK